MYTDTENEAEDQLNEVYYQGVVDGIDIAINLLKRSDENED